MNELIDQQEPVNSNVSPWPIALRHGLLAALVMIVIGLAAHLAGFTDYSGKGASNWIITLVNWAVLITANVMVVKKYRDENLGGFINFGKGFKAGFQLQLVIALITLVWSFLFFTLIEPNLIQEILDMSREQMMENQSMSEAEADQALNMMKWMFSPVAMSIIAGVSSFVTGLIIALIVASVMKKEVK